MTAGKTRPIILGHRGASHAAPENTIAAFALAREMGADGVELDVRRAADATLVVHHDPQIVGFGLLRDHDFDAIRAAHPEVPTLREALDACAGMLVNVEIKCLPWEPDPDSSHREAAHTTVDLIRELDARVIVSSFDLGAVDAVHAYAPELPTAWLTSGQAVGDAAHLALQAGHHWLNPDRVQAKHASPELIADLKGQGLQLGAWTVDDPTEARSLFENGVAAIITNEPDVLLAEFS
jgi:glycerophosphoryl diester phosphodiesterase